MSDFRLLGPLEVVGDGGVGVPLQLGGPVPRALLAALLLHANHARSADSLIDDLWGSSPPESARASLQAHVSRLRKTLEGHALVRSEHGGYVLDVPPDRIDALQFERLANEGHRVLSAGDLRSAARNLDEAVSLWRGPVLADLPDATFADAPRARLDELRLMVEEDLVDARLGLGQHEVVVAQLEERLARHPLRERSWAQLMLALYRSDRQADALAAYQRARRVLVDELGIEPGPALRKLESDILRSEIPAVDKHAEQVERGNLPAALTAFVAREGELNTARSLLAQHRVITLVGVGGAGKTRLAIEVASRFRSDFADGAWLVDLAPATTSVDVVRAAAASLGVRVPRGQTPLDSIVEHIDDRHLLLLLDNCEHVIEFAATLAAELLRRCVALTVLATSRAPLEVHGEAFLSVRPLELPQVDAALRVEELAGYGGIRLFLDRAAAADPAFETGDSEMHAVVRVCHQLDGLPLAIELAAARLRHLSIAEIEARVGDRFALLESRARDIPERHRSLRAVLDSSWDLLSDDGKNLLSGISVFAAAFSPDWVAALYGRESAPVLERLVDASLVTQARQADATTYRLLQSVRDYASLRLAESGEADVAVEKHARYFARLAGNAAAQWTLGEEKQARTLIEQAWDDIRAAIAWSVGAAKDDLTVELLAGACRMATYLGRAHEIDAELEIADGLADAHGAGLLTVIGIARRRQGRYEEATAALTKAVALAREAGSPGDLADTLAELTLVLRDQSRLDEARAARLEALALNRELGDTRRAAWSGVELGQMDLEEGRIDDAESNFRRALDELTLERQPNGVLSAFSGLMFVSLARRDHDRVRELGREALDAAAASSDPLPLGLIHLGIGIAASRSGDARDARAHIVAGVRHLWDARDLRWLAEGLDSIARLERRTNPAKSVSIYAAVDALRDRHGLIATPAVRGGRSRLLEELEEGLGSAEFAAAQRLGRTLNEGDVVDLALAD